MDIIQALIIAIAGWLVAAAEPWFAYPQIDCPLVLCPIVGLILGDVTTGVICGATLQLIFIGVMPIGGTLPQDAALGSIIGTALAIATGQDVEIALTFAVPVSIIGSTLTFVGFLINTAFTPLTAKFVDEGNMKAIEWEHRLMVLLTALPKYVLCFFVLAFGTELAQSIVDVMPQTLIDGMDFASNMMPAVGIALLLKMMWNKNMAVYFFLGLLLALFFAQNTLSVALMGVVVAVIVVSLSTNKPTEVVREANISKGEDLFDD